MPSPLAAARAPRSRGRGLWRALGRALPLAFVLATVAPAAAEPPPPRPQLTHKPSGFWTSSRPAKGGAYRYRMLGIGAALAAITGLITYRVIRGHGGPRRRIGDPATTASSGSSVAPS